MTKAELQKEVERYRTKYVGSQTELHKALRAREYMTDREHALRVVRMPYLELENDGLKKLVEKVSEGYHIKRAEYQELLAAFKTLIKNTQLEACLPDWAKPDMKEKI